MAKNSRHRRVVDFRSRNRNIFIRRVGRTTALRRKKLLRATVEPMGPNQISDRHRANSNVRNKVSPNECETRQWNLRVQRGNLIAIVYTKHTKNNCESRRLGRRVQIAFLIAIVLTPQNESSRLYVSNGRSRISRHNP